MNANKTLTKKLSENFYWVGNLDPDLRVFDIVMHTQFGTTYNSYILRGTEKTVLFEAAKARFFDDYMEKIEEIVPFKEIDCLVVNHTEPDHTGTIEKMLELNPDLEIIGTTGAANFLAEITNKPLNAHVVKAGDKLDIGGKTLEFIPSPNLHWPDTMFTWVSEDGILFTCDCFGAHYAGESVTNENLASKEDYLKSALYYFDNILGPFKGDVLSALRKIEGFDIKIIATGHGPVITKDPQEIIKLYGQWAKAYEPGPRKLIVIPYVSAYGYTKMLADKISEGILSALDCDIEIYDMVEAGHDEVMGRIAKADGILLGTPTVVGEALPPIWSIAADLNAKLHGGKFATAFGSYGWTGEGVPHIMQRLGQLKLNVYREGLRVRFKPSETQLTEAYEYGAGFGASVRDGKIVDDSVN
jgi:flavorubredoxin